jgi:hypothetical protein
MLAQVAHQVRFAGKGVGEMLYMGGVELEFVEMELCFVRGRKSWGSLRKAWALWLKSNEDLEAVMREGY